MLIRPARLTRIRASLIWLTRICAALHRLVLLPSHLIQSLYPGSACLLCHTHSHKPGHRTCGICCCCTHGIRLRPGQSCRCHPRIPHDRGLLQLLDHIFVLFGRCHTVHPKGVDLNPPKLRPLSGQNFIQRVRQLHRMPRQSAVADTHLRDPRKRRLQGSQELRFEHRINLIPGIHISHISAHICIERHRIHDPVRIFSITPDRNIHVQPDIPVHYPKRHRIRRTIFIPWYFLNIHIIDPLIFSRAASKLKTLPGLFCNSFQSFHKRTAEYRRAGAHVISIRPRLRTCIHHPAVFHDDHTLSVCHRNMRAVGNDVVVPSSVGRTPRHFPDPSRHQHIRIQGITVKIFLPLIRQRPSDCIRCCSY